MRRSLQGIASTLIGQGPRSLRHTHRSAPLLRTLTTAAALRYHHHSYSYTMSESQQQPLDQKHNVDTPAPQGFKKVTEGKATILFPDTNEVFYNPIQEFNRDISIAAIRTWDQIFQEERRAKLDAKKARKDASDAKRAQDGLPPLPKKEPYEGQEENSSPTRQITILEALSASGLRSVRYAKEIPNVRHILTNDLEADAVSSIKRNADFNGISPDLLEPHKGDAM